MVLDIRAVGAVMRHWYQYRSKDKKVRGIVLSNSKAKVARLAGYPVKELGIERVRWNGKEFVKCKGN